MNEFTPMRIAPRAKPDEVYERATPIESGAGAGTSADIPSQNTARAGGSSNLDNESVPSSAPGAGGASAAAGARAASHASTNGYADSSGAGSMGGPSTTMNGAGTGSVGAKTFNAKQRTRMNGLPPPVYTPLGASSPSMSSNAPSAFANSGSGSSSAGTTPSASPQQSHNQLPPVGGPPSHSYGQQGSGYGQSLPANQGGGSDPSGSRMYPALHLYPLNDTFIPKQISLYPAGQHNRIKIGRQTNAKTVPAPNNGYFDSKVLSRAHAEVWCEAGKVFIKDVKSSNGTFINGERLSPEAVESDVFELHNNDMVEFGIDITSEDTKTIVHHKVAARCYLVMNAEDAAATSRNFASYYREMDESAMHRRAGLGGKSMGTPGLNLDQVLGRLQTELAKSREIGNDLSSMSGAMGEIHDTLGGNLPGPPMPAYRVPSFVPSNSNAPLSPQQAAQQLQQQAQQMLSALQSQLHEAQSALNGQVERMKVLESRLTEQERMRSEFKELADRMEDARQDWERLKESQHLAQNVPEDDVDSDKEELEELEGDETRTIRIDGDLNGLLTKGGTDDDVAGTQTSQSKEDVAEAIDNLTTVQMRLAEENSALSTQVHTLSTELTAASQLSTSLKTQYSQAAGTIRDLEEKVRHLETALQQQERRLATVPAATATTERAIPSNGESNSKEAILREVESRFIDWKKSFEDAVKREREGWQEERERLRVTVQEWERRSSALEQQAASSSRRKRRAKASTAGSLSEHSTSESDSDELEEGLISPITDDSSIPASTSQAGSLMLNEIPVKRPRSRRRKRAPSGPGKSHRKKSSSSHETSPESHSSASREQPAEEGGSSPQRRRSWIPFAQNLSDLGKPTPATRDAIRAGTDRSRAKQSALYEHPAVPLVSAAGIVVIGYLAYTAVLQHQK